MDDERRHRFYGELAVWWPLISPPEEYAEEAAYAATLLASAAIPVQEVLELGSGGGHNAVHLKAIFAMTLVDLSPDMLAVSERLNPDCAHHEGDMRTVRLGRRFDTAFVHCRPGGVAVLMPDHIAETFVPETDHDGHDGPDGRAVRFLDWSWDPDPADTSTSTEYAFLLRAADGTVEVVHETHRLGLFGRDVWLGLLAEAGFVAEEVTEVTTEDRRLRQVFVDHRPR